MESDVDACDVCCFLSCVPSFASEMEEGEAAEAEAVGAVGGNVCSAAGGGDWRRRLPSEAPRDDMIKFEWNGSFAAHRHAHTSKLGDGAERDGDGRTKSKQSASEG